MDRARPLFGALPYRTRPDPAQRPFRATGARDHQYEPGNATDLARKFPFSYGSETDPLTGRTQGILDRCTATNSCPKIVHAASSLEMWELRQSLGFTDPLGTKDLAEPANVRSYIMASTQHSQALLPLPVKEPFGVCQQQGNPNPHNWTMRALLTQLTAWVKDGTDPPPSIHTRPLPPAIWWRPIRSSSSRARKLAEA